MKKANLKYGLISAVIMLLLPFLTVTLVRGDGGMAICFILFFAVNPIWSLVTGLFAGSNLKAAWFQPLLASALFLAGVWLVFDMGEPDFLLYAVVYLAIGSAAMALRYFIHRKKQG